LSAYLRACNMKQFIGKTYDNYLDENSGTIIESVEDVKNSGSKVTAKMVKTWGPGFEESDYIYLEDQYKDWISRYECKTKAQETIFSNLALAQLSLRKAHMTGDTKKIKEATDTYQSLMTSANIKPNQVNENALAEVNTFGTLIKQWENHKPIPKPDPEWEDVDGIGHYFRAWVLSPILEMFKLKNPYREEYEEELKRYTAQRPHYEADDEENDDIRQIIFGAPE